MKTKTSFVESGKGRTVVAVDDFYAARYTISRGKCKKKMPSVQDGIFFLS
jgi:hypothetical protein